MMIAMNKGKSWFHSTFLVKSQGCFLSNSKSSKRVFRDHLSIVAF